MAGTHHCVGALHVQCPGGLGAPHDPDGHLLLVDTLHLHHQPGGLPHRRRALALLHEGLRRSDVALLDCRRCRHCEETQGVGDVLRASEG
eukprot:3682710-Prymnesium_polylepis.2